MRLDLRLVVDRLARSRSRAKAMIRAGVVRVDGQTVLKSGTIVAPEAEVSLEAGYCPWVSRGALKLLHGLERFGLSPKGRIALDLGASTGGFTEVLLARGARRVYAVDVGSDQLDESLREHPHVVSLERTHARDLTAALIPEPIGFLVADVSFISLTKALPAPLALCAPEADCVLLVKPQFEVGPARVGKGGLVRDPAARQDAVETVAAMMKGAGWRVLGQDVSPIAGGDGNEERLLAARKAAM